MNPSSDSCARTVRAVLKVAAAVLVGGLILPWLGVGTASADDLVIDLGVDPPTTIDAGESFTFVLEVFEDDGATNDVILQYFIPDGVTVTDVVSNSGDPLDCQAGTPGDPFNPLNCRLGIVNEEDATIEIEITVATDPGLPEGSVIDTDAQVCQENEDGATVPGSDCGNDNFPQDNELHFFTEVTTSADLAIRGTVSPDPVVAGQPVSYQFDISNLGPSVARGAFFRAALPSGLIFREARVLSGNGDVLGGELICEYAVGARLIGCELGDIQPSQAGLRRIVQIEADTDSALFPLPATLNVAGEVLSSQTSDPVGANNLAPVPLDVTDRAAIEVRKSSSPLNPVAGETFLWTYEIENLGPTDARNLLFTDTLPQGTTAYGDTVYFEYVDDQANGFCTLTSNSPDTIECRPAGNAFTNPPYVLPAGETVQFSILVRIDPRMPPGQYTNLGSVSIGNSNSSITSFGDDVEVRSVADLRVNKFVSPGPEVRAGEQFTYTILVDNLGPSTAYNVVVTDTLITSGFVNPNGCSLAVRTEGGLIDEFDCNFALATGVFDLATMGSNHLNPRSPTDMGRIIITINATADEATDLNNVVTVTSDSFDPNTDNNIATVAHDVTAVADLSVTKAAVGEVQVAGQEGTIIDLAAPPAFPEAPNYTTSPTEVTAGRRVRYTLTVTNDGPSRAENVTLRDDLPQGVTLVPGTLTASQGNCNAGTPGEPLAALTCGLGLLVSGQTETVTFDVLVASWFTPNSTIVNDVQVWSDTFDPDNGNDFASTQTVVNTWADTEITKLSVGQNKTGYDSDLRRFIFEDLPGQVTAGHELRYEITVQNKGASDAQNVQILDLLPGQSDTGLDHDPVTFLRADGASCRPLDEQQEIGVFSGGGGKFGQVLWCSLGALAAGERVTFDIYVHVDNAVPDGFTLTNGAFVWWGASSPPADPGTFLPFPFPQIPPELPTTDDPFLDDNFADTDTDVNAVADVYIEKTDEPAEPRLNRVNEPDLALAGDEHRYLITFGNNGWSVARDIAIQDFLDFKQFGILGENFLRCEPFDIDDFVSCSENGGVVDLDLLLKGNEQIVPGDLNPGDEYSFYLITEVDPGYVLDADDFIATNDSRIATSTTDFRVANNVSAHDTKIIAEADLTVEKVDDAAGVLQCDPVQPGGMISYQITVTNEGPSDAAEVWLVDQLPAEGVVLDPDQVTVTVNRGDLDSLLVRDDGFIELRIGNDPNNEGEDELGRINADSDPVIVTIQVMVAETAECGSEIVNEAYVETRANAVTWPDAPDLLPGVGGGPRTPTVDPDPSNNRAGEATTVECPSVTVTKTVSFDGQCPGVDLDRVVNQVGRPVTFCFEITNNGTTFLDTIQITDTLDSRTMMPTVIFTDTITFGEDEKLPVAPGETVRREVTIDHLLAGWECGIATDTVVVSANPVNSGRTDLACLTDVTAEDTRTIEVPCDGVDYRLQLPALGGDACETWVQVQNVGDRDTKAALVVWGEGGACPPQAAGPLKVECSGLIRPGSAWSFAASQIPVGARSGVVYSLNAVNRVPNLEGNLRPFDQVACDAMFRWLVGDHNQWAALDDAYRLRDMYRSPYDASGLHQVTLDFGANAGEPLAVSVNRSCADPDDDTIQLNAAYRGISSDQEGARDPRAGAYAYYAPLVFASRGELNSTICIQNSGTECTSLELWLSAQDNCLRSILADVLSLSPGESICFDPNDVVGPDWLGSAWIRSTQPLGMVIDTVGESHFTSYHGSSADVDALSFTLGNQVAYAPLIYSEYQGWDSVIQVQNYSAVTAAKVKVYFLDRGGDIITTLIDWICPRGSQTFFLPVLANIPGNWVGSARVESQEWWSPGQPLVEPPRVGAIVMLEKWADPARTSRREAVAYNAQNECLLYDWQLGSGKGGTASGSAVFALPLIAKENRGITTEVAITNLVPKPGFTDFAVYFYDQNGLLDSVCEKLNEKQVEYINMDSWGWIQPGYLGSLVVSAVFWEHDVFDSRGGFTRNVVGLGGVAVERVGSVLGDDDIPGDESKAYEGFPVFEHFGPEEAPNCPGLPPRIP